MKIVTRSANSKFKSCSQTFADIHSSKYFPQRHARGSRSIRPQLGVIGQRGNGYPDRGLHRMGTRIRVKGDALDADRPGAPALRSSWERDDFRAAVERGGDPGGDAIGRHQQGRVGHVHVQLRGANFGVTD